MSPLADIENDLLELKAALRQKEVQGWFRLSGRPLPQRVFLTGANPFVLKAERLLEIAGLVKQIFPDNQSIGCFARITDIGLKSEAELAALRQAGFAELTIGVETADETALAFMHKGYQASDILTQCRRLEAADISYNFFYLTGISGRGHGAEGALATAELCNQLHPTRIGASMLTVYDNSELYQEIQAGRWQEETEIEKYQELRVLLENLQGPVWFGALGASNAVPFAGDLPAERPQLLAAVDTIIQNAAEGDLLAYRQNLRHL